MKQTFELYILNDKLTSKHWDQLYKSLASYLGTFSTFELDLSIKDNVIRFFVSSDKDVSSLSNNIDNFVFHPADKADIHLPNTDKKERFLQFVTGGNILDLKEKYLVKKNLDLLSVKFKIRVLNSKKCIVRCNLYFKDVGDKWSTMSKSINFFPSNMLAIDFENNTRYLKKSIDVYLDIEKSLHVLTSEDNNALFEVDTFPYMPRNYYLNIGNYNFDRHSFIIGASGSGKSKFIALLVDRINRTSARNNYRIVVIDPHSSIAPDFKHIKDSKVVNFSSESTELFSGTSADISAATELTATLFKSLMNENYNPKVDRVLRYSLFVLFTAQNMSLDALKRFLSEVDFRNQIIEHVTGYVPTNIIHFFGATFNEMRTKYYSEAISPLVSLIDELELQPVLVGEGEISLSKTISDNFLTVFSLNKVSMGERVVKTVAGLLIQQIFLLAQASAFSQKIILVIDEVSVVQNPALASILAEARKFNLSVILSQQYFGQIEKDLRDSIFANVFNYYTFKVSEEDARSLEGNLNINLPSELIERKSSSGLSEKDMKIKIMTELHPRECIVRVLADGQVVPALKAKTVDAPNPVPDNDTLANELREFKIQPITTLPTKFKEASDSNNTKPELNLESPKTETVKEAPPAATPQAEFQGKPLPFITDQNLDLQGLFNLSELIAEHSSSRYKVNKRKK